MREITVKLYKFDELDEKAKDKAREWARDDDGMRSQWAFDTVLDDANRVGLDIYGLDLHKGNSGEFLISAIECANSIRASHGKECEIYKTVNRYWENLHSDDKTERENSEHEFLYDLLENYRIMFDKQVEYSYGQEAIDEDIRANEYEFMESGKIA